MEIITGNQPFQQGASSFVRMSVFVLERNIQIEDEFDGNDLPETIYTVVYDGKLPVSTGRYIQEDETTARFTRIATLKEYRGKNIGTQMVRALEEYALSQGITKGLIHAETQALPFYQKLGYHPVSEVYYEDGMPCQTLEKQL